MAEPDRPDQSTPAYPIGATRTAIMTVEELTISAQTSMSAVTLRVSDLAGMSRYYENALALSPLEERSRGREVHRVLGRLGTPLLRLVSTPDLPPVDPRQAGLFHTAFLFDSQADLAATVFRAAQEPRSRFAGSSDHLVSEAFYFTDPEGNGIELYWDRDRGSWHYAHGEIQMDTIYLDPNAYLKTHLAGDPTETASLHAGRVGHVHLQVGDLETARRFYVDAVGFAATLASFPGALFASAGGYHHHVAMNTWNSAGAGPRAASLGLGQVAISVPGREDLDALAARLRTASVDFRDDGNVVTAFDPWGTEVSISLPEASAEELLAR